ncbi:MAG: dipeptidase [Actinocrinis sp.]
MAGTVGSLMPTAWDLLAELVAFRSVADPLVFPKSECDAAAQWVARAMREDGFVDVAVLDTPDGRSSVYGYLPATHAAASAPTVLLYAHYDVQPPLDESAWLTPPFELTERDGRWYARGAADCKGAIVMHLLALRTLKAHGGVPVNVKLIVEGSEEQASGGLEQYAEAHPELLAADAILIGDAGNFRVGVPTVTASLRGISMLRIQVDTLARDVHSGQFGGAAPDALHALIKILASLTAQDGSTGVDGLPAEMAWDGLAYTDEQFRADAGVLDGVDLIGSGKVADRLWARPSLTVMGIDCPPVTGATPSVHATARALVGLRMPPGQDQATVGKLLREHVERHTPWNVRLTVEDAAHGQPFRANTDTPAYAAMADAMRAGYPGSEMQVAGQGGGIPLCNTLATLYPDAEILLIGLNEPEALIHGLNESVSAEELERMTLTEAHFLLNYARMRAAAKA